MATVASRAFHHYDSWVALLSLSRRHSLPESLRVSRCVQPLLRYCYTLTYIVPTTALRVLNSLDSPPLNSRTVIASLPAGGYLGGGRGLL